MHLYWWQAVRCFRWHAVTPHLNATLMDLVAVSGFNDKGEAELFQRTDTSFQLYGETITFHPGDYGIDMFYQDGEYYLPLQLFSDIILAPSAMNTLYNGENVFLMFSGNLKPFEEIYYNAPAPEKRSEALANFNYNELCFALGSYRMKEKPIRRFGPACRQSIADMKRYADARAKYYPNGTPGYEEIGNTAYITFDEFVIEGVDYYEEKAENHLSDTMGLMIYSRAKIKRPNSPIKTVVLDLSNNGGGTAPSAAYTIGMFLGEGSISVTNPLTGALVCQNFKADLNMDRQFDEKDNLLDYNLFCLTSPNSFSCGNLVPSALKNSHRVTILGQTSGGGACVVQNMTTADGCMFNISGPYRLAYTKNGSFYDIDQGVTPDFVLPTPDQFYDRKQLTRYINKLLWK